MNLADALVKIPQDERGGEIAIRGFEYQRCWAIDELLSKHKRKESYVFIPEYHDDILILDSANSPQKATFAQVKTRDGHWTLTPLIKPEKDGKLSYVSKLFKHQLDFKSYETELSFVTNALFKFSDKYEFTGDDLDDSDQKVILLAIQKQLTNTEATNLTALKFKTSKLSLLDYDTHLIGKVFEYLEDTDSSESISAPAFKKTLVDLFEKKTRVSSREINSFEELINKKGISNELIEKIIKKIKAHKSNIPEWETVSLLLSSLNKDDFVKLVFKAKYDLLLIKLKNTNSVEHDFYNRFRENINVKPSDVHEVIIMIDKIIISVQQKDDDFKALLDSDLKYIIACCAMIEKLSESEAEK